MPALPSNVGQSACRDCGESLIWAYRNDGSGRRHPPLERAWPEEKFFILDDDGTVQPLSGQVFTPHRCQPPDIDLP